MPEVNNVYADAREMDIPQLHGRREEILSSAPEGDYSKLSDDHLSELLAINRALRTKISHSNSGKKSAARAPKQPSLLDDLA